MAIVFRSRHEIESLHELADGGEAKIYDYKSGYVIKLFHTKVNLKVKEVKVKFFVSVKDELPDNVVGPQAEVLTNGRFFVGYAMQKLVGAEDLHMLTKQKYLASMHFSNRDVLSIITSFGVDLGKLHSKGILVGDISDYNFQIIGRKNYFIDVDSYGVVGKFMPDAYTELFTCPDSYMQDNTVKFSMENENYNFAVLAFYVLTRIHPFGGTYLPDKRLSTLERMKRKISIIGKYSKDIKIPKIVASWKWMSPQLQSDFLRIFENGEKIDITPSLKDCLNNLKHCSKHDVWYYSKFTECPLCNENAKVKVAPVPVKASKAGSARGPQLVSIFSNPQKDCAYIFDDLYYLTTNYQVVHVPTGRKVNTKTGTKIYFSDDGKFVYIADSDIIKVFDENNECISVIERMPKTDYIIRDTTVFYVDRANNFIKLEVTNSGNRPEYITKVYKPFFEVSEDGRIFIVSKYPGRLRIYTKDYNFDVSYTGWINEYAIKYDPVTHHWLFAYQLSNGNYRTIVFSKDRIKYDDDVIKYNAMPLSNIDFANNTIYDPDDGKIIGTNIVRGIAKEFACGVVDESSRLQFTGKGFKIYNPKDIYKFE